MDFDGPIDLVNELRVRRYSEIFSNARRDPKFPAWVSTLHPEHRACRLEGAVLHGASHICQRFVFDDDDKTTWLLRLPIPGYVAKAYADEKVAMEVEVLALLRDKTSIPVPDVKAWGLTSDNPLGLGPYILMDFIKGVGINEALCKESARLLPKDVDMDRLRRVYREMARIQLQLFSLDFDHMGSLPTPKTGFPVPAPALTFKLHDILISGGVDTFGNRTERFEIDEDYFEHLYQQQWAQLDRQPGGWKSIVQEYKNYKVLQAVLPEFIIPGTEDSGAFKFFCDDLGLRNVLYRSKDDLTPVAVIDWEWSYAAPVQLAGSAPWWLLQGRPSNWDMQKDPSVEEIADRFVQHLEVYKPILQEEEKAISPDGRTPLTDLVTRSQETGSMWMHMLLTAGFVGGATAAFVMVRRFVGEERWLELEKTVVNEDEMQVWVKRKLAQEKENDELEKKVKADVEAVNKKEMTFDDFLAKWGYLSD
ncbi:hypothetical protein SEUCBS139899_001143 [Sporothrix eucalyptigena]|uniref:Aminoglycoside phosphotransferase domain-containing protein n=1 Tax=Sporothrix eucalyptigena TaxID=1812306 RepID=A0ABP0B5D3_9PEZI